MARIFEGVRVLDLSQEVAGAFAGMVVADHGAEVVEVEPLTGDPVRDLDGCFVWHRGKESLALDMEHPTGRDVFERLLTEADVLIESYGAGVMDAWGLGYEALQSRFPQLVYCAITGYGQEGQDRDRPGLGELVEARLGLQYEQAGYREGPIYLGWPLAENGGGIMPDTHGSGSGNPFALDLA